MWLSTEYTRAALGGTGTAKCGGNYAASLLPQAQGASHGCAQVAYLDAEERTWVDEMGSNNLFFVYGSGDQTEVVTPALTGSILAGVTRDSMLVLAKELGCQVTERRISGQEWLEGAADGTITEVFGCGTAAVITPIGGVKHAGGEVRIGDGEPGPITLQLRSLLTNIQRGAAPDTHSWMRTLYAPAEPARPARPRGVCAQRPAHRDVEHRPACVADRQASTTSAAGVGELGRGAEHVAGHAAEAACGVPRERGDDGRAQPDGQHAAQAREREARGRQHQPPGDGDPPRLRAGDGRAEPARPRRGHAAPRDPQERRPARRPRERGRPRRRPARPPHHLRRRRVEGTASAARAAACAPTTTSSVTTANGPAPPSRITASARSGGP